MMSGRDGLSRPQTSLFLCISLSQHLQDSIAITPRFFHVSDDHSRVLQFLVLPLHFLSHGLTDNSYSIQGKGSWRGSLRSRFECHAAFVAWFLCCMSLPPSCVGRQQSIRRGTFTPCQARTTEDPAVYRLNEVRARGRYGCFDHLQRGIPIATFFELHLLGRRAMSWGRKCSYRRYCLRICGNPSSRE
ncbi:uncharacterized protein B0T23DRAFT_168225 [Neurospora hispaniola]|uniref:Uncharacterized protein n=1 Tax=Neurospora hispaniola TaxID=588809 RepID=A0AAJ0MQC8_9PEZI|nr:hypothetical protein B0T23DRAFT_168225 [Neurospora hispaniola]